MQLKYSNYAAFSHIHGRAVNNSGLLFCINRAKLEENGCEATKILDEMHK